MTEDFYVLVQLVHRMTYCSGEDVINQLAPPNNWGKRATILLGFLLGTGLAGAASVGTLPLILQDKNYMAYGWQ